MDRQDEEKLFLSVITMGEIQRGIYRLPASNRKAELTGWVERQLLGRFMERIIPITAQTMLIWGKHCADMEKSGQPISLMDSLLIATAIENNLVVVTRNSSDFLPSHLDVINPWND